MSIKIAINKQKVFIVKITAPSHSELTDSVIMIGTV